jgi:branched-chain amino acid transport system ATP-binding protein
MKILEVRSLTKNFGGLSAVRNFEMDVNRGEILGLIGPNGAGKTTVFNMLSGFCVPSKGTIFFKGNDITGLKPNKIAKLGLVRSFQTTTLLKDRTVLQNVIIGLHLRKKINSLSSVFNLLAAQRERKEMEHQALELMRKMGLAEMKDEMAENLSYGLQRTLGVTIALAANPELILLDEPVAGMSVLESAEMMKRIREIRDLHISVLLVEHDMKAVMSTCDRLIVLSFGRKIAEGTPNEIRENKEVIESYLGISEDE